MDFKFGELASLQLDGAVSTPPKFKWDNLFDEDLEANTNPIFIIELEYLFDHKHIFLLISRSQ